MAGETPIRSATGAGTIPAGTLGPGTVTTEPADNSIMQGVGTSFTSLQNNAGNILDNNWIYFVTAEAVAKITGVYGDTTLKLDRNVAGIAGDTYHLVEGDLQSYSVNNNSGAAITLNGVSMADDSIINEKEARVSKYKDVAYFNAAGTIEISENQ